MRAMLLRVATILVIATGLASADSETQVEIEKAPEKVEPPAALGTRPYQPRPAEEKLIKALPEKERVTATLEDAYDIHGKKGMAVSWFGIVRSVTRPEKDKAEFVLQVEHKYFDGWTDVHIQAVSFNGAGDFKAVIHAKDLKLPPLCLVRVYGTVSEENDGVPVLDARYVRVWPWRTFTFMLTYGEDHSNPKWRAKCKVKLSGITPEIYDSCPDDHYYRERLGEPEEEKSR